MVNMEFNVNVTKFGFKKMKFQSNNLGFPIVVGINLSVTGSKFEFPDIKFDV